ncbi:PIG-L family deacetylase [Lacisediminihabitans sp. H27-G8]|uniref:PIG-L family deacetylase n=1 Tax=Lacisediminihabitans sp. H27-G8 TaxID=3111909 RepID=UPI0038FC646D
MESDLLAGEPFPLERVLFVHAHPDDESITTGGTIALLVERGSQVTVVTCTRGELGEVIPADLPGLEGDGPRLAEVRTAELAGAMTALGVSDHRFLGEPGARWVEREPRRYTDSGMRWGSAGAEPAESLAADSFCAADFGEVAADLATVIDAVKPGAVISYDSNGGYGHPDHVRAHAAARHAAEVMGVPFWIVDADATDSALRVDVSTVLDRKTAALGAHRTQIVVEGERFSLSSGPSRAIESVEGFTRLRTEAPGMVAWTDQGLSVKIFAWVIAALVGAALGGITVVNHQFAPQIFGMTAPVGIVVSLLIIASLLVGLRIVFSGRVVAGCAAAGLLLAVGVLSVRSTGGSVLVPANAAGYALTYGSLAIAGLALAWPNFGTFSRDRLGSRPESKGPNRQ